MVEVARAGGKEAANFVLKPILTPEPAASGQDSPSHDRVPRPKGRSKSFWSQLLPVKWLSM